MIQFEGCRDHEIQLLILYRFLTCFRFESGDRNLIRNFDFYELGTIKKRLNKFDYVITTLLVGLQIKRALKVIFSNC